MPFTYVKRYTYTNTLSKSIVTIKRYPCWRLRRRRGKGRGKVRSSGVGQEIGSSLGLVTLKRW